MVRRNLSGLGLLFAAALTGATRTATAQEITKPRVTRTIERLPAPSWINAVQQPDGSIRVTWNSVEGATRYVLDRSVPNIGRGIVPLRNPGDTSYVDRDVQAGAAYYYQVYAAGSSGMPGLKVAPPPVTATISYGQTVTSSTPSDTAKTPVPGPGPGPGPAPNPSPGPGPVPAETTATATPPAGAPGAVTGLTATPAAASVSLAWVAPSDAGSGPIDSYNVEVLRNAAPFATVTVAGTSRTVTNLPTCGYPSGSCGQPYQFRIRAHNPAGLGAPVSATAVPKVSYYGDGLPVLWQAQGCLRCHASSPPNLSAPRPGDYAAARGEGPLIYKKPSQSGVAHAGGTAFSATSAEYRMLYQWVADGALQ